MSLAEQAQVQRPTLDPHHGIDQPAAGLLPPLFTELFGTFVLTFVDAGGAVIASLSSDVTSEARSLAAGLTVMAMVYALGDVSGAHINPAVTFAFAARRVFPWRRVPAYWAAQIAGALLAAGALRVIFGDVASLGATEPHHGVGTSLAMETILTSILVTVILCTSLRSKVLGPNAALAAGGTVAVCNLFAKPISGASMNPARSLGPAIVSGTIDGGWIYVVGPMVGAVVGVFLMHLVHRHRHAAEARAAAGDKLPASPPPK